MKRRARPGLSVGGDWIVPVRDAITDWELAYIIEMPVESLHGLGEGLRGDEIDFGWANDVLHDLAGAGFTTWRESSLFAQVISGQRSIDSEGNVWLSISGRPFGSVLTERVTNPVGVVEFDWARWRTYRQRALERRSPSRRRPPEAGATRQPQDAVGLDQRAVATMRTRRI